MAVDDTSDLSRRVSYIAPGAQATFPYPFRVFDSSGIKVSINNALQSASNYTITGAGNDTGGSVIFSTAPATGAVVVIYSDTTIERDTDYQQNGPWTSSRLNDEFDKVLIILQELRARIERAIRGPVQEGVLAEMPGETARASKYPWFDVNGDLTFVTGDPSQPITHTSSNSTLSAAQTVVTTPEYVPNSGDLTVYQNGIKLVRDIDYTETSDTTITLTTPATNGDVIEFVIGAIFDVSLLRAGKLSEKVTAVSNGQTVFNLTNSYVPGYDEIEVYFNGAMLIPGEHYLETSSTSFTLAEGAEAGDTYRVIIGRVVDPAPQANLRYGSIESASATQVTFPTLAAATTHLNNAPAAFSNGIATAPNVITLPQAGIYQIQVAASFLSNAGSANVNVAAHKNGVIIGTLSTSVVLVSGGTGSATMSALVQGAANDTIRIYHSSNLSAATLLAMQESLTVTLMRTL